MNDSFIDLVRKKVVEPQEAYARAMDKAGSPWRLQEEQRRHVLGSPGSAGRDLSYREAASYLPAERT